jgi:hypothetical protein
VQRLEAVGRVPGRAASPEGQSFRHGGRTPPKEMGFGFRSVQAPSLERTRPRRRATGPRWTSGGPCAGSDGP